MRDTWRTDAPVFVRPTRITRPDVSARNRCARFPAAQRVGSLRIGTHAQCHHCGLEVGLSFRTEVGDFEQIPLEQTDFVYADPPYDVEFRQYSQGGFPWEDQVRTAEWLSRHRGPVVLVNQATKRVADLYRDLGYCVSYLNAPRRISCTGDRTPAREVIATRNL